MIRRAIVPAHLLLCLVLGGASAAGYAANFLLQLIAIPIIAWALWQLLQATPAPAIRAPLWLMVALVTLILLQLIPLPPAIWAALPGRHAVVDGYGLLGIQPPWLPLSLAPQAGLPSLFWLLPAFAVLLGIVVLAAFRGRLIAGVLIGVTLCSVALGALQIVGGSSAYFYEITNYTVAVGFFANSNHNATLMLICIPFLAALQKALLQNYSASRNASAIRLLTIAGYAVIFVGLLINASLAGIGLGVPDALISWLVFGHQRPVVRRLAIVGTALISIAVVITIAVGPFGNNLFGAQHTNVELTRQTSFSLTTRAALQYLPIGSGVGSFQPIYHTQEPLSLVTTTYMNHAHSDWLELLLETGVAGMVLAALFLAWWAVRVRAIWRAEVADPFAQAAAIASAAVMIHSIVDYPLRTAAISALFAACIGIMTGVRPYVRRSRSLPNARHMSI